MYGPKVTRTPLEIRHNSLPQQFLGRWLFDVFRTEIKVKPALDDMTVVIEVSPVMIIVDKETKFELFRFQTAITFTFSGARSTFSLNALTYQMVCLSIDEFNIALKETKSTLATFRNYNSPTFKEIKDLLKSSFDATNPHFKAVPRHWKRYSQNEYKECEVAINELPPIPLCKQYHAQFTDEIYSVRKFSKTGTLNANDEHILKECIAFYKLCIDKLRAIDLCHLSDEQALRLIDYLDCAFTVNPNLSNEIETGDLHRVTIIQNNFLEDGKVRNTEFLSYPPVSLNRTRGTYGRANTPETSIFYASTLPNVAVRETKPLTGSRIILTKWNCSRGTKLIAYPLTLTAGINNEFANKASMAFEELCKTLHPLYGEWMECLLSFFSNEFIQENPAVSTKGYEYLYSSFFAGKLLSEMPVDSQIKTFDCIVYPSVAWNHVPDNIAIRTDVIDKFYTITSAHEFIVHNTWYNREVQLNQYPAQMELVRTSTHIENNRITWNDDNS